MGKIIQDKIRNSENLYQINVFQDYKSQLKAFSKKKFDPFCRRERLILIVEIKSLIQH